MNFLGIIPARYASTRFPGKPLALINGKTMISRVFYQASNSRTLTKVIVATDDERIKNHIEDIGGTAIMTSANHNTGTERCLEAANKYEKQEKEKFEVIINIQGDEPFVNPEQIDILCSCFNNENVQIATLIKKIVKTEELTNPNIVKVITDLADRAIYFSRSAIPFVRGKHISEWLNSRDFYKHIGIYAYRKDILDAITKLKISSLEKSEALEQLRWLENGFAINTLLTDFESLAVDTPEDLLTINQHLSNQK
jgi:3-deoxy-manno-octulosonate cytidylyltransferase (CMP-KDO synthetase)